MPLRTERVSFATACLILAGSGCLGDAGHLQRPVSLLTDSIPQDRVITVDRDDGPSEIWFVSEEPSLILGERNSESAEHSFAEITDVRMLTGGQIAVADLGVTAVRLFDLDGTFLGSIGRLGDGPGEYRGFEYVRQCDGQRLFILDMATSVMKVFSASGEFVEQFRLFGHELRQPPYKWDCASGVFMTMGWGQLDARWRGPFRNEVPLAVSSENGEVDGTLGWILGPELYSEEWGGGPRPLGAVTDVAVHGDRLYVAQGPEYRVYAFRLDGAVEWALVRSLERRPVDRDAYIDARRPDGISGDELRAFENRWRNHEFPDLLPAFRGFLVDASGNVWVEAYPAIGDERTQWSVFSRGGAWLADVPVPYGLEVMDVGDDYLLGVMRDELDVQRVLLFSLFKSERSAGSEKTVVPHEGFCGGPLRAERRTSA